MGLGDFFPEGERQKSIKRQLTTGTILYLHCIFTTPPKDKYLLLLVSGNPDYRFFVINTHINDFIKNRQSLKDSQVSLPVSEHTFLDHDSFINCSEIRHLSMKNVESQLIDDMSRIKGEISEPVRTEIINAVTDARTLSKIEKKEIIDQLSQSEMTA